MFRHGEISTEIEKGPFWFTVFVLVGGVTAAFAILHFSGTGAMNIVMAAFLGVMSLAAAAVLFALISDRTYIDNEVLYMSYLFKRSSIPVKEIGQVSFKDDVYTVYDRKKKKIGTINALATGIDRITSELNRNRVNFV